MHSIDETADKLWAAIQRVSPSVTRDEVLSILREAMDAPTADATADERRLFGVDLGDPEGDKTVGCIYENGKVTRLITEDEIRELEAKYEASKTAAFRGWFRFSRTTP